jgi:cytochrome c heme-lyase
MGSSTSTSYADGASASACPVAPRRSIPADSSGSLSNDTGVPKKGGGECPVQVKYKNPTVYNVYSQKIDPNNQMPIDLNTPPTSATSLTPERVKSTIPKGGTDSDTWLYPSPQMFYNALARKNKLDGVEENDMNTVVAIHNNMNENTWRQILAWESLHEDEAKGPGREPKLLRFMGRPDDLSPRAWLKSRIFGCCKPFDRHDWIVDRGGKEIRYVIDYYHDESAVSIDKTPESLMDATSVKSIKVDVRPAVDSLQSIRDVFFKMPIKYLAGNAGAYSPPAFFREQHVKIAEDARKLQISKTWSEIQANCKDHQKKLKMCSSESECGAASIALQLCVGGIVCPNAVDDFKLCAKKFANGDIDEDGVTSAYSKVTTCLENFELECKQQGANSK